MLLLPQRVALIGTKRTRPRQTRHALSEGRGVAQFPPTWQAGWYVHVSHVSCGRVDGACLLSHLLQRIELILTRSTALDTIVRIIPFSRRGSHCSARGGVAAEGTSRNKNVEVSITFSDPYQKCLREPWKFTFFFPGRSIEKLLMEQVCLGFTCVASPTKPTKNLEHFSLNIIETRVW